MTSLSLACIVAEELARVGLEPVPTERGRPRRTVFMAALPGFGLRHYESGRRVYIVQRRMGGRMRTITLGSADTLTEAVARDVAARILLRCQVGESPAATRARVRSAPSWNDYLNEYWTRVAARWKPSTRGTNDIYRRVHLDGAFAGRFIDQIEEEDVARWFARVSARSPGAANRTLAIVGAMMNKAEAWGYREPGSNPAAGIKRNRQRKFERFLSEAELASLGTVLQGAGEAKPVCAAALLLLLLLLTGCRRTEIVKLRWSEVRGRRLLLSDSKTGARPVWLGAEARAIIDRQPRPRGAEYVFDFGAGNNQHRLDAFWREVRAEAGLGSLRLHDLRHSYASYAVQRSETLPMVGKLLGHAVTASTARYAHLDDAVALSAAQAIGERITAFIA